MTWLTGKRTATDGAPSGPYSGGGATTVVVVVVGGETGSVTVVVRRTVVVVVAGGGVVTTSSLEQATRVPPATISKMRRSCVCITANFSPERRTTDLKSRAKFHKSWISAIFKGPDGVFRWLPECRTVLSDDYKSMTQSGFEPVEGSGTSGFPAKGQENHPPGRDESVFRLLLEIESRLRKQAREESLMAFARSRIFRNRNNDCPGAVETDAPRPQTGLS